ncbi:MAG: hypothetical protein IPN48_05165 [Sphingomonadales bacterium]|nr:hypothetical protein [Sphingomonadales bacterium]
MEALPGSEAAIRNAQEAIFLSVADTMKALQPALGSLMETSNLQEAKAIRSSWIDKLHFLNGCLALPDLCSLSVALRELDRGVVSDALLPDGNMQGGKSNTERLRLMAYAVEAADELKRRCEFDDEYRAELKDSKTAHATIEKYRKAIRHLPEFAPRIGWQLYWQAKPKTVLSRLVWAIKVLDKRQ